MSDTATDWIVEGAHVVVISSCTGSETVRKHRITRVTAKTFTLDDGSRYRIGPRPSRRTDTYGPVYDVWPVDHPEAVKALERSRKRDLISRAQGTYTTWLRRPTKETRVAAIEALQRVED